MCQCKKDARCNDVEYVEVQIEGITITSPNSDTILRLFRHLKQPKKDSSGWSTALLEHLLVRGRLLFDCVETRSDDDHFANLWLNEPYPGVSIIPRDILQSVDVRDFVADRAEFGVKLCGFFGVSLNHFADLIPKIPSFTPHICVFSLILPSSDSTTAPLPWIRCFSSVMDASTDFWIITLWFVDVLSTLRILRIDKLNSKKSIF